MRRIYHYPLSAGSRTVRLVMGEKHLEAQYIVERFWEERAAFMALNPAGEVPVLEEPAGLVDPDLEEGPLHFAICGPLVIAEYLDEIEPGDYSLIGARPVERAEARRLADWFLRKFEIEVTRPLFEEKILKRLTRAGSPDSVRLRTVQHNIREHLAWLDWLLERRRWVAGEQFSLADLAAASALSCLDFIGDVSWDAFAELRDWYARVKSRPSFRGLLEDRLPGIHPPEHYARIDF